MIHTSGEIQLYGMHLKRVVLFLKVGWLRTPGTPRNRGVMTPVANVTLPAEHLYNSVHISTRNPIEIGPCIDNIILKNTSNKAKVQLIYIINGALKLNYFPNQYKTAIVIPIPKTGKNTSKVERPISLLNSISKIMERIIHKRLND
jgi:hypothetical protein